MTSADANDSLSDGYLGDGQTDLAREYAEKALALLDKVLQAEAVEDDFRDRDL